MRDFVWGSKRLRTIALVLWAAILVMGIAAEIASAVDVPLPTKETLRYGDFPVVGRRVAVWVIAQLHLMFGAFVVGVPLFILFIEIVGAATKNKQFDDLAHEFTRLLSVAFSTTATFGGILVFFLIGLYPTLTDFLAQIFFPSMVVYVFLFFGESFSMYLYYYGWDALKGSSRSFGSILGTALLSTLVFFPGILLLSSILRGIFGADASVTFPLAYVLTGLLMIGLFVHALLPGRSNFLHSQKWMHICFGILLNYFGLIFDDDREFLGHVYDLAGGHRHGCRGVPWHHLGGDEQLHLDAGQPAPFYRQYRLWRLRRGGLRGLPVFGRAKEF